MLATQRQATITAELRRAGAVRVADLTELLGVSDMTIRRDLEQLSTDGIAHKVHGGAVLAGQTAHEPDFALKSQLARPAKTAIAERAAALIRPGAAIGLSAGSTTWAMARHIAAIPGITVVTNSTTVADAIATLDPSGRVSLILTGGVRTPSAALVGPVADRTIRSLHVDQLFLGVHGIDIDAGFTTPNLAEATTNQALVACAREVIVVADSSKWGVVGLAGISALRQANVIVTDNELPAVGLAALSEHIASVITVEAAR